MLAILKTLCYNQSRKRKTPLLLCSIHKNKIHKINNGERNMDTKNYVLIGEAGSGKTEIAANLALLLARTQTSPVCLIDMDQTKCLFRARDFSSLLKERHVHMAENPELWDSPLMPQGVSSLIQDDGVCCVLDAGGNAVGATMLGQYAELLAKRQTRYFYVINPCRAFSGSIEDIEESLSAMVISARIPRERLELIANPFMGEYTTAELILEASGHLKEELAKRGMEISGLAVSETFSGEVKARVPWPVLELSTFVDKLYV